MSVHKSDRDKSSLDYYHYFYTLKRELTNLALRNFGVKSWEIKDTMITDDWSDSDKEMLEYLINQYHREPLVARDPQWFIDKLRDELINLLLELSGYISDGYKLQTPIILKEAEQKRLWQDQALGCCEKIIQLLQYAGAVLPINLNTMIRFIPLIEQEEQLIKDWRKDSNKDLKKLQDKGITG